MFERFVKLGLDTIYLVQELIAFIYFLNRTIVAIFSFKTYNVAMLNVLIKQIYFTSVQMFGLFFFLSLIIGTLVVSLLILAGHTLGVSEVNNRFLTYFIAVELAPLFTVLLISLRSGSAINTEIAVMRVSNEVEMLECYGIDVIGYLVVPRVISGGVSVLVLSMLFVLVSFVGGYFFGLLYGAIHFTYYFLLWMNSFELFELYIMVFKSVMFGFVSMVIPIYSGLGLSVKSYTAIPISVMRGMVKLSVAIILIEVLSLSLQLL